MQQWKNIISTTLVVTSLLYCSCGGSKDATPPGGGNNNENNTPPPKAGVPRLFVDSSITLDLTIGTGKTILAFTYITDTITKLDVVGGYCRGTAVRFSNVRMELKGKNSTPFDDTIYFATNEHIRDTLSVIVPKDTYAGKLIGDITTTDTAGSFDLNFYFDITMGYRKYETEGIQTGILTVTR